jgi:hypothetical protein
MGSARPSQSVLTLSVAATLVLGAGVLTAGAQTSPAGVTTTSRGVQGGALVAPPPVPPAPEFGFEESLPLERGGIREQESYAERPRGVYAPAFVRSTVRTVRTSKSSGLRMGLAGWTATRVPFDDQNAGGGPAFGFTIEWGVPLPPPDERAAPAPR